jgi:hypothetical protein
MTETKASPKIHDISSKKQLETLNAQARDLEQTIARNVAQILEAS